MKNINNNVSIHTVYGVALIAFKFRTLKVNMCYVTASHLFSKYFQC